MPTYLIIHGSGSTPQSNWFPWLRQKLEKEGNEVFVPQFPNTPDVQTLENWMLEMDKYELPEDTIAIGHSLGVAFLLNLLEKRRFKSFYLVAGFVGLLGNEFDEVIHTFCDRKFDWKTIKENYQNIHIIYSDNDPYVPAQKALELGERCERCP